MKVRNRLTSAALALILSGCGSSPKTHFYTLSTTPAASGQHSISSPVQVTAVHLPPSLDRRQMVRMTGANSVEVSEVDRWSGAFDEMIRNVLSQDLAVRLSAGRLIFPDAPPLPGTRMIVVTVAQFGPTADGEVQLQGSWALLGEASGRPMQEHNFLFRAGPAPDAAATAAAMSRTLGELASAIAHRL
ncbi:MAG TPA: ABC-type transport auxiliary lipoprotein family protein [Chthoniobacterales bacterium]